MVDVVCSLGITVGDRAASLGQGKSQRRRGRNSQHIAVRGSSEPVFLAVKLCDCFQVESARSIFTSNESLT